MNSQIHNQEHQPLHHSVLGFTLVLAWILAFFIGSINLSTPPEFISSTTFQFLMQLFVNWKIYTLVTLMLGFKIAFLGTASPAGTSFFKQHFIYLILTLLLAMANGIALAFIPIIMLNVVLYFMRKLNQLSLLIIGLGLFAMASVLAVLVPQSALLSPCFNQLAIDPIWILKPKELITLLFQTEHVISYLYGFSIMILGLVLGKNNWFIEYNFNYTQLAKLFIFGILLILLWLGLNYFNIYQYIQYTFIGHVFYNFDLFSLQLIVVYCYIFFLIYLENYTWGKFVHLFLGNLGVNWILQLVGIFMLIGSKGFPYFENLSFNVYFALSLTLFLIILGLGKVSLDRKKARA